MLVIQIFANELSYNRGETLYFSKGCTNCHGPSAEGSSTYPKLANKQKNFIIEKLKNFKAGKTNSVSQEMMAQFVNSLSDKNIEDIACFLSQHKEDKVEDLDDDILGGFGS